MAAVKQRRGRTKDCIVTALIAATLYIHFQSSSFTNGVVVTKKEETLDCSPPVDHFRYRDLRFHKNVTASNAFLRSELSQYHAIPRNPEEEHRRDCRDTFGQVIVGRFGASEQHLISYSELPSDTTEKIPSDYVIPGYYFLPSESASLADQRQLAQFWGRQRREAYAVMNAFGLFDWDYRPDQIQGVQRYAPDTAWLHAGALYPPCLPIFDSHYNVPWTESLRGKTILIVHPFIDTIQQQIPKLTEVWSKVNQGTGTPPSCLPIEANMKSVKFVRARLPVAQPTKSWLEVLEETKQDISAVGHFDVALVSCGGFGLPVLAHIASLPHKPSGIYVGAALQLYFGIHGARWYSNEAGYKHWQEFYTDAWTWPLDSDLSFSIIGGLVEDFAYVKPGQAPGK
jgi:hypothetical protein